MLKLEYSRQFKKDFKKIAKLSIPDVVEVGHVIKQLQLGETLPEKYVDHSLSGQLAELSRLPGKTGFSFDLQSRKCNARLNCERTCTKIGAKRKWRAFANQI